MASPFRGSYAFAIVVSTYQNPGKKSGFFYDMDLED